MAPSDDAGWSRQLWDELSRAFDALREHAAGDVARHGLSLGEFGVLEALVDGGPLRAGELQEEARASSGGVTYLVDRLEERGLVERRPDPDDRRARLVELTGRGREMMDRVLPQHAAALQYATSGLDTSGKRRAVELLRELGATAADLEKLAET